MSARSRPLAGGSALAVGQPAQAAISPQFARSWGAVAGADRLPELPILAAAQHDIGWLKGRPRRGRGLEPAALEAGTRTADRTRHLLPETLGLRRRGGAPSRHPEQIAHGWNQPCA